MSHPSPETVRRPFQAIAAMSENRVIGRNNRIPWHLPEDLRWFKYLTEGQVVVFGRKTFDSLPKKPLPNRESVVLTHRPLDIPGVRRIERLDELDPSREPDRIYFICGGGHVYAQGLSLCSDLYMTIVKQTVEGDVWFPPFEEEFRLIDRLRDTAEFEILHFRHREVADVSESGRSPSR